MKIINFKQFLTLFLVFYSFSLFSLSFASTFKGYPSSSTDTEKVIFREPISRFEETSSDFLILFAFHASFYRFPKFEDSKVQMQEFINKSIKTKKIIEAEIDPVTTEIIYIKDLN